MKAKIKESALVVRSQEELLHLFGRQDEHLRMIQEQTGVDILHRGDSLIMRGDAASVDGVDRLLRRLLDGARRGRPVEATDVKVGLEAIRRREEDGLDDLEPVHLNGTGKPIKPRTRRQREYIQSIREKDLTFGIGPAGTGKTYLGVAMGLKMLLDREIKRIVLTRPAVEAGEKLGFLPGDMQQKVDPYLRPLYDAMFDILDHEKCQKMMERGVVEVAPLAFMRGRTLESAFVILDEAQNATIEQLRMFLTRLGRGSKAAVTGDVTQIDLEDRRRSGLLDAVDRFANIPEIGFVHFTDEDVMRHELVRKIIKAYDEPRKNA